MNEELRSGGQPQSARPACPVNHPLVLCLVGTDHHRFDRLVQWVDACAEAMSGEARFLVQHGASVAPQHADGAPFLGHEELTSLIAKAAAVVCHAGPATIMEARRSGHIPIVIPRDPRFREHVDDHQIRFAAHLAERALVTTPHTASDFATAIRRTLFAPPRPRDGDHASADSATMEGFSPAVETLGTLIDRLVAQSEGGRFSPRRAARPTTGDGVPSTFR